MQRRGFVFSCLSAVAGLFGVRGKPETATDFPANAFATLRNQETPLRHLDCGYCGYCGDELIILLQGDKAVRTTLGEREVHAIRLTRAEFYTLVECVQKCGCLPDSGVTYG